jgi:hypothetical protein
MVPLAGSVLIWGVMHLTYPNLDATTKRDRPTLIEITPEMTDAGIAALQEFNLQDDCLEWIVGAVYEAMVNASPVRP